MSTFLSPHSMYVKEFPLKKNWWSLVHLRIQISFHRRMKEKKSDLDMIEKVEHDKKKLTVRLGPCTFFFGFGLGSFVDPI